MTIYLVNKTTKRLEVFNNVINWDYNFVLCEDENGISKIYCDTENEYFTSEYVEDEQND